MAPYNWGILVGLCYQCAQASHSPIPCGGWGIQLEIRAGSSLIRGRISPGTDDRVRVWVTGQGGRGTPGPSLPHTKAPVPCITQVCAMVHSHFMVVLHMAFLSLKGIH